MESYIKLIVVAVVAVVLLLASVFMVDIVTVEGNQIGVKESWGGGVESEPLLPKTYILFPGFTQRVYTYEVSQRVFVMNDLDGSVETGSGRARDSYKVQSKEGQDMNISLSVQWQIDPLRVVEIHKTIRDNIEEKLIRPYVMRVVKDEATVLTAIEAYSGEGLVKLQQMIGERLSAPDSELRDRGILVLNFVIEHIGLQDEYLTQIMARQVAVQRELRAIEEEKAALAEAERAKAEAQAELNRAVVTAEKDRQVGVIKADKEAQQQILAATAQAKKVMLAAEAEKNKRVLEATGERDAALLLAEAIEAKGKAEAEATRLKLSAYSAVGSEGFIRIEVAKSLAEGFKNIRGYLPEDMQINVLSENFLKSVDLVVNPMAPVAPATP